MKPGLGKKKDLNTELNLTPFIDLLSTCVCFLLITAVWIEIGALEIKQSTGTEAADSTKKTYDLDIVYSSPQLVNLNLKKGGKRIKSYKVEGKEYSEIVEKLNNLIHDAFRAHCYHQMLPLELEGKLRALEYRYITHKPLAFLITRRDQNSPARHLETMVASFAVSQGILTSEVEEWQRQLTDAEARGRFGFTSYPVLTSAYLK